MSKMDKEEFKGKCVNLANAISGLGFNIRAFHKSDDVTVIENQGFMEGGVDEYYFIVNTENGVFYTKRLDLDLKMKKSDNFLEVVYD